MQHKCSQLVFVRLDKAFMLWYYYGMCNRRVLSSGRVDSYWVRCNEKGTTRLRKNISKSTFEDQVHTHIAELAEDIPEDYDYEWSLRWQNVDRLEERGFTPEEVASRVVNYAEQYHRRNWTHETGKYRFMDSYGKFLDNGRVNMLDLHTEALEGEVIDGK